jgi:hypothetical protein
VVVGVRRAVRSRDQRRSRAAARQDMMAASRFPVGQRGV